VAPSRTPDEVRDIIKRRAGPVALPATLRIVDHETREAIAASDATAVASGTVTLEAAILGTPMVVVYKESAINWHLLGRLIHTEHYGLVNLIAGERLMIELMQDQLSGERLAAELALLLDVRRNQELRERLQQVVHRLGEGGASRRAAESIVGFLSRSPA
jgi:lipid-A-disaccharide synthase